MTHFGRFIIRKPIRKRSISSRGATFSQFSSPADLQPGTARKKKTVHIGFFKENRTSLICDAVLHGCKVSWQPTAQIFNARGSENPWAFKQVFFFVFKESFPIAVSVCERRMEIIQSYGFLNFLKIGSPSWNLMKYFLWLTSCGYFYLAMHIIFISCGPDILLSMILLHLWCTQI